MVCTWSINTQDCITVVKNPLAGPHGQACLSVVRSGWARSCLATKVATLTVASCHILLLAPLFSLVFSFFGDSYFEILRTTSREFVSSVFQLAIATQRNNACVVIGGVLAILPFVLSFENKERKWKSMTAPVICAWRKRGDMTLSVYHLNTEY